jgi:hypothetical protein
MMNGVAGNLRRYLAMMRLRNWFEKQVFIRLGDDQTAFTYTTKRLFISRFTIGDAQRNVALDPSNVAPLSGGVLHVPKVLPGANE